MNEAEYIKKEGKESFTFVTITILNEDVEFFNVKSGGT